MSHNNNRKGLPLKPPGSSQPPGHRTRKDFRVRYCGHCEKPGHATAQCPLFGDVRPPRRCHNCGETGHIARNCRGNKPDSCADSIKRDFDAKDGQIDALREMIDDLNDRLEEHDAQPPEEPKEPEMRAEPEIIARRIQKIRWAETDEDFHLIETRAKRRRYLREYLQDLNSDFYSKKMRFYLQILTLVFFALLFVFANYLVRETCMESEVFYGERYSARYAQIPDPIAFRRFRIVPTLPDFPNADVKAEVYSYQHYDDECEFSRTQYFRVFLFLFCFCPYMYFLSNIWRPLMTEYKMRKRKRFLDNQFTWFEVWLRADQPGPLTDQRADALSLGDLKHNDPKYRHARFIKHVFNTPRRDPDFWRKFWKAVSSDGIIHAFRTVMPFVDRDEETSRKGLVSEEIVHQLFVPGTTSLRSLLETFDQRLDYTAAHLHSVNYHRADWLSDFHIFEDTKLLVRGVFRRMYQQRQFLDFQRAQSERDSSSTATH